MAIEMLPEKSESDTMETKRASRELEEKDSKNGDLEKKDVERNLDGVEEFDANVASAPNSVYDVYWTEPANEDPENPMNWTPRKKWEIVGVLSFLSFLT